MKIGIFTDTYRPSVNGIVYVTDILRRNFEALGHEVYIFAPGEKWVVSAEDPHLIQFSAIKGAFYEDYNTSLFFPPKVLKKIKDLDLDIIHFLTPGQVGLMAVYAAHKLKKPLVAEYCTDLFEYVEHYPFVLPGILALGAILPFAMKISSEDAKELLRAGRPRLGITNWNRSIIKRSITILHENCDAVIVHSRKSRQQLQSWLGDDDEYRIELLPTGIDPLPAVTDDELQQFKKQWGVQQNDELVVYVGRLGAEKNLDMLIDMLGELLKWRPNAKLMYVGDFEYRQILEEKADATNYRDRIIFTGKLPREKLRMVHNSAKVFAFPSLTDTQGLVVHEAALSCMPLVLVDDQVSEVLHDGDNGYYCKNDPVDMAAKIAAILEDPVKQGEMGSVSCELAGKYSEMNQVKKLLALYEDIQRSKHTGNGKR